MGVTGDLLHRPPSIAQNPPAGCKRALSCHPSPSTWGQASSHTGPESVRQRRLVSPTPFTFSWYHLNMTGRWNLYITHKHSRKNNTLKTSRLSQLQRTYNLAARPRLPRCSGCWRPQESLLHAVIFLKQQPSAQNHQETPSHLELMTCPPSCGSCPGCRGKVFWVFLVPFTEKLITDIHIFS